MAENNQPFTEYATKTHHRSSARIGGWIVAGVLAVLLIVSSVLWKSAVVKIRGLESLRGKLNDANASLVTAQEENQTNKDLITTLQNQIAELKQAQETTNQMSKSLESEMRDDLESKDVTISNLQGQLTVTILDQVMFDSGEASLKPDGQAVMRKVAAFLTAHPKLQIQVIGYTDNMPIRPDARSRFASNWELSTARALAAVHFLIEQAGVDPRRVGAAGYGQYRPIASNATAEGRAKNRRIEITILSNAFIATGSSPITGSGASTNAPPQVTETNLPPPSTQSLATPTSNSPSLY
jgi:chemotaxis protein MotB